MGCPFTCSRTRYGWPAVDTPASMRRAMCGCVSFARKVPSRRKRSSPARPQERDVQQLDRGTPFEAAVTALRQPDAAHPALADEGDQPVGADDLALQRRQFRGRLKSGNCVHQKPGLQQAVVLGEQALEVGAEGRVACADGRKPGDTVGTGHLEGFVEVRTEHAPAIGAEWRHGTSPEILRSLARACQRVTWPADVADSADQLRCGKRVARAAYDPSAAAAML